MVASILDAAKGYVKPFTLISVILMCSSVKLISVKFIKLNFMEHLFFFISYHLVMIY